MFLSNVNSVEPLILLAQTVQKVCSNVFVCIAASSALLIIVVSVTSAFLWLDVLQFSSSVANVGRCVATVLNQWHSYTRACQGTGPGKICLCPGKTSQ